MAATGIDLAKPSDISRTGRTSTWLATVFACAYFAWTGISLYYSTPIFLHMFSSMGLEMSFPAVFVVKHYRLFYPVLFGGMAAAVIIKQFYVREKWVSMSITLMAVGIVDMTSAGIVRALYHPIQNLVDKLAR